MTYYHYISSFFLTKNEIIYLMPKIGLFFLFLLFEIFDFEIQATNHDPPVRCQDPSTNLIRLVESVFPLPMFVCSKLRATSSVSASISTSAPKYLL